MSDYDQIAAANERVWEEEVKKGCGFTVPWLDLNAGEVKWLVEEGMDPKPGPRLHPHPLSEMYPTAVLRGVKGREVLCLASGGGQQSAIFGLLGARVTVVDLAQGQLDGDEKAAAHYGYSVRTVKADMRDLSCLESSSFDMVYQGESMSWVPDIGPVYAGVARVLKPGGNYRVSYFQPAVAGVEWNGKEYCICRSYTQKTERRDDGGYNFRHYMDDIFNGLVDLGFSVKGVYEAPYSRQDISTVPQGGWTHQAVYVGGAFAVVARR